MEYKNFSVAIYCTVHELDSIDTNNLENIDLKFNYLEKHIKVSKVYLETFRSDFEIDYNKLLEIKQYFNAKGIKTSGGITTSAMGDYSWDFKSICYSNDTQANNLIDVIKRTALVFDEIILDDFYFTNCKCSLCVNAKGQRSWKDFRLDLMSEFSQKLVCAAREANPNVKVIIKFPNWYDEYQSTGYNPGVQKNQFDYIYTGTETRDPYHTQQNLQKYSSYFIMRYMENIKPNHNLGGWFDTFDCMYNLGSYAEQGYLTLFAKAKEITLFCLGTLLGRDNIFVPVAGHIFNSMDTFLDSLGNPIGIKCYKPYNSSGENYLHGYIGMLGIPLDPAPSYSFNDTVFLTESASFDNEIITKISKTLENGNNVIVTSGFIKEIQEKGFSSLVDIKVSDRKYTINEFAQIMNECSFRDYYKSNSNIIFSELSYSTNDSKAIIVGLRDNKSVPILIESKYLNGKLFVLNIPDNFGDLYNMPNEIINTIRNIFLQDYPYTVECKNNICLFSYDNNFIVLESFIPHHSTLNIVFKSENAKLKSILDGTEIIPNKIDGKASFKINLLPTTYGIYQFEV